MSSSHSLKYFGGATIYRPYRNFPSWWRYRRQPTTTCALQLLQNEQYEEAAVEAQKILDDVLPRLLPAPHAALVKGKARLLQTLAKIQRTNSMPNKAGLDEIREILTLALQMDPENAETKALLTNLTKMKQLMQMYPQPPPPEGAEGADADVLIVGAGASGVGMAMMLTRTFGVDPNRVMLVEKGNEVGDSFRKWPDEMRFISPSFNQRGWTQSFDLNSVNYDTSPAFSLHCEHPSGKEYASYLAAIVESSKFQVLKRTTVVAIEDIRQKSNVPLFEVKLEPREGLANVVRTRYIVWAAGEFQHPKKDEKDTGIAGSQHCTHNSEVRSWSELPGDDYVVIGGFESGVDACVNLARAGKKVRVLASTPCWAVQTSDPSSELAPYTALRLRRVMDSQFKDGHKPVLMSPLKVVKVEKVQGEDEEDVVHGMFKVTAVHGKDLPVARGPLRDDDYDADSPESAPTVKDDSEGKTLVVYTDNPPILATGFIGSVRASAFHLFDFADEDDEDDLATIKKKSACLEGAPLLTDMDESTKVSGVYLVGPEVSHGSHSFCFIYKFRQRLEW